MKPRWLIKIHHLHAVLVSLLLLSGLSLFIQPLRTFFNEWKIPLVAIHTWIALFYILIVLFSLKGAFTYIYKKPTLKKFNVRFILILYFAWSLSGGIMYFQANFPVPVRNVAVTTHDLVTWVAIPWILVHSLGHAIGKEIPWPLWWKRKVKKPEWIEENRLERRDFVKSLSLLTIMIFIGGWLKWLSPMLHTTNEGNRRRGYFRIYNVTNDYPRYENSDWSLKIDGLVEEEKVLSMQEIRAMKWSTIIDDFHCVTGWSVKGVELTGIYVKDLFEELNITPKDQYVTAHSGDGMYFDTFTLTQLMDEGAMLVFELDGAPLKKAQGYPCRLYHPTMYGYKSVKWLERLTITGEREYGYWQQNGDYDLDGYL
jgi:methionine sulfoxide reductase catalytic subunit